MKENFTLICALLDRSGSMSNLVLDTIGGFNGFLTEQKEVSGDAALTLCLFDTQNEIVHDFKNIKDVSDLTNKTYKIGGGTALLDALGTTIDQTGNKLSSMQENERPSKVVVLVITDGEENSSNIMQNGVRLYTKERIKEMISHQQEKYNWSFLFLGANLDSVSEGAAIGIASNNAINYTASHIGTQSVYANVSRGLARARQAGAAFSAQDSLLNAEELDAISKSIVDLTNQNIVK